MDLTQVTIETERLLLLPMTMKYIDDVSREYREPITTYMHFNSLGTPEDLKSRIEQIKEDMKKGTMLRMAAVLKNTKEFVGSFALENVDTAIPEMGGWLKVSAHGHGYGKEAAAGLKKWADENIVYDHIIWPCAVENIASRKVAESLGGTVHKEFEKVTPDGRKWTAVEYWIYKE